MLVALHSVTIDQAYCLQDKEIVFSCDRLSSDLLDVGTIDITNRSVNESAFQLDPLNSYFNINAQTMPSKASGLQCCKSKVIMYSPAGMFSCYDMLRKQNIPYLGISIAGGKNKQMPSIPINIRFACASRADDDICFFATAGDSISVMYFTGQKNGQNNHDCSARLTSPIKLDQTKIGLGKGGMIAMTCHPILPILFVMGTDGVFVLNYSNLLQRLNNEYALFLSSSDGNNDRNDDISIKDGNDNDDMMSESGGPSGGFSPGKSVGQRRRLSRTLFGQKSTKKTSLLDFVCVAALVAPNTPSQEQGDSASSFKMSVHTGGAFIGIMWKWGSSKSSVSVGVYDIRSSSLLSTSGAVTPLIISPIAQNYLKGVGSATKSTNQPAVFSICFHSTEPLLFIGLISRQASGSTRNQIITVCSLTLLEPSLRVVGLQNLDPPVLEEENDDNNFQEGNTHATEIICDRSGAYILIVFKHSVMKSDSADAIPMKNVLRNLTISSFTLSEEWRRNNGCCLSIPIITQVSLPTSAFQLNDLAGPIDGVPSLSRLAGLNSGTGVGSIENLTASRAGRTVVAVRPLGEISLTGKPELSFFLSLPFYLYLSIYPSLSSIWLACWLSG